MPNQLKEKLLAELLELTKMRDKYYETWDTMDSDRKRSDSSTTSNSRFI
jgi:hypothetical protein